MLQVFFGCDSFSVLLFYPYLQVLRLNKHFERFISANTTQLKKPFSAVETIVFPDVSAVAVAESLPETQPFRSAKPQVHNPECTFVGVFFLEPQAEGGGRGLFPALIHLVCTLKACRRQQVPPEKARSCNNRRIRKYWLRTVTKGLTSFSISLKRTPSHRQFSTLQPSPQ